MPTGIIYLRGDVIENPGISGVFIYGELERVYAENYYFRE